MLRSFIESVRDALRGRTGEELEEKFDPKAGTISSVTTPMPTIKLPNLSDRKLRVVQAYLVAGKKVGYKLSLLSLASALMSVEESLLDDFARCEREYVALGYRAIDAVALMGLAGWNRPLPADQQPCTARKPGEQEKLYAEEVRRSFSQAGWSFRR